MIIVAGALHVDPDAREVYLADGLNLTRQARGPAGCLDFIRPPIRWSRTGSNVCEQWGSVAAVEEVRGSGPSGAQQDAIRSASVWPHEIGSSKEFSRAGALPRH